MYINYKSANKKRGNKGRSRWIFFLCIIVLVAGMGFTVFYFMRPALSQGAPDNSNGPDDTVNKTVEITPTQQIAAITPTQAPTSPPVEVVTTEDVQNDIPASTAFGNSIKGIYVPARVAGSDKINSLIDMVEETEVNAMVIDVKDDDGKISYAMDSDLVNEIGAATNTITDIQELIHRLKEKNIYLIARVVAFKDPYLAGQRPDLAIKNKDGTTFVDSNGLAWVNPYNKKVWDYLVDVASQAAAVGFDEVQFDYIRFSTSKAITQANFGDEAEGISKAEIITEFTKYAYEKLKPLGVYLSADVYGTIIASSVDAGLVGQDYVQMAKYLDYICPMIYPSHFGEGNFGIQYPDTEPFQIISKVLALSEEKLSELSSGEHCAIVRPWLQDFTATWVEHHIKYGPDEIREQIEAVYSVGYDEWLLWNSGSNYTEGGLLEE